MSEHTDTPVVTFGKLDTPKEKPHFLDVQVEAFNRLLQPDLDPEERRDVGLERVFSEIFPITDVNENFALEFVDYELGQPKYTVEECMERDMTFAAPLKATLRLVMYEEVGEGEKRPRDILEKEVYLGDLPMLTEQGTFVVNGAERVIVSQLHRSPGVVFESEEHPNGTILHSSRIIPFRGSWVEFTLDIRDVMYVHIDKNKKFPATALLRALGYGTDADILSLFHLPREVELGDADEEPGVRREVTGMLMATSVPNPAYEGSTATLELSGWDPEEDGPAWVAGEVSDPESGEPVVQPGDELDKAVLERLQEIGVEEVDVDDDPEAFLVRRGEEITDEILDRLRRAEVETIEVFSTAAFISARGSFEELTMRRDWSHDPRLAADVVDEETGEVLAEKGDPFDQELFETLKEESDVSEALVFTGGPRGESPLIKNTLEKDPTSSESEALHNIYSLVRPGEAPNLATAREALDRLFFNPKRYDLGRVGRHKVNHRLRNVYRLLDFELPDPETTVLAPSDFVGIVRYLVELHEGRGYTDDIDHLGNRRVRSIGELIANQFSVGLSRMARLVRERMSINNDPDNMSIDDLVNARTVSAVIQSFFGSSQLSQFMDQTNPLAELTHKRRLSALGPGGLTRERAGFEVRDVHYSHYGRMCPIETPEGPNIGLITSMTTYARLNELGFLETPYRKVVDGKVTDEVEWLSASEEEEFAVAQANAPLNEDGSFEQELVLCRRRDDYPLLPPEEIDFMDVAPDQLVAMSPALIPFLEHDDANRALMGSNMQRQGVPLLFPEAPLVGTGLEEKVAQDSGATVLARRGGEVTQVTADEIVVDTGRPKGAKEGETPLARLTQYDRYRLRKFWRTNQDTAVNQRPVVRAGEKVEEGQVIADGPATDGGSLALGRNVLVAFMPWFGYNFEDAIVISERLVQDDVYTSVHIQELEMSVRDTKRGMEEITREIPNVADEDLVDLDERGIVRIGAKVESGDILAGKITPKGETELSPEEKLLTAIFGEKAKDVKDSSLRVPPGVEGTVIDVKIFSRRIDDPILEKEHGERIAELRAAEREEISRVTEARDEELREILHGNTVSLFLKRGTIEPYFEEGKKLTKSRLDDVDFGEVDLSTLKVKNEERSEQARRVIDEAKRRVERIRERTEEGIDKVFQPDELKPGVVQLVKVYLAEKRKISVGDKMAGRHGNKGVIARVVPEEDMPFLPDGSSVDIALNPLGVPSRMNVGQLLETHLGWAARILGFRANTPIFQGATEHEIGALLKIAGAIWAAHVLGAETEPPEIDAAAVRTLLDAIQSYGGDSRVASTGNGGPPVGLGRSLDEYLNADLPKGARDIFEGVGSYVLDVARELADATVSSKLEEEGWTAASVLSGQRRLTEGLDDAVVELMRRAGLEPEGKARLRDGRSGEYFDDDVTVGEIYMMKLEHLVDDKVHARSIGPYSLVTQQPLAGKAQFGGQRFGEMEVWALEAYGAAHTLQEMLTVKSDDVSGRSEVYETIVKGENLPEPGIPESFNVLVKELQALGLSVQLGAEESDTIF